MASTGVRHPDRAGSAVPSTRVKAAAAVTAAVAATVLAGAPIATAAPAAPAADPSSEFHLEYGASYALGHVRWHQRSVDVDYSIKAYGCRQLVAYGYDANGAKRGSAYSAWVCDTTYTDTMNVPVDVAGGPAFVRFYFVDENNTTLDTKKYLHP
jgi:hypothetical protein